MNELSSVGRPPSSDVEETLSVGPYEVATNPNLDEYTLEQRRVRFETLKQMHDYLKHREERLTTDVAPEWIFFALVPLLISEWLSPFFVLSLVGIALFITLHLYSMVVSMRFGTKKHKVVQMMSEMAIQNIDHTMDS